jgi:hypothetical protein
MSFKEEYCEQANELAYEMYGKEFHELSKALQDKVWGMAEGTVVNNMADQADFLRKQAKEGDI